MGRLSRLQFLGVAITFHLRSTLCTFHFRRLLCEPRRRRYGRPTASRLPVNALCFFVGMLYVHKLIVNGRFNLSGNW
ncbi:hypothetical protein BDV38DRAFT_253035 [Aspergillus pseudotamarii]|uniref:Uncharacterized protein n=1 Tax=Aspergillus pseudotamarii TaxID=132259 RepID=A0A5N6SKR6_ASPPS|nr:uncharacterized protein BDV38DRAFT_253035 [Aspergillus pseudotamarii]KAE8135155.1 hypothetical protein BDV38DRAFT_253035 [Aspergillus pseudotamarii]